MRTTLTLDDDVATLIKRLQEKRKIPLKQLINEALRDGLQSMNTPARPSRRYRTKAVDLGNCLFGSVDDVAEVLAVAEGETFR